jgi:NO-binding membrane sensor protein with MHYT domain
MLYLWFCISQQHEHRLVLLAALLCMAGSIAAILLMRQARDARKGGTALDGAERWLAMAGLVTGFAIWATHFVAMLGYLPGTTIGYRIEPTVISLGLAAGSLWLGFWLALHRDSVAIRALATLVIGAGIGGCITSG